MVSIDSPWLISYSTSVDPKYRICHHFWNIWRVISMNFNYDSSRSSKAKGHGANRQPMGDFLFDFYWLRHRICHLFLKYLTCNFNDLELGQFRVIKGQTSWCPSTANGWLHIRLLLIPTSYLSPFFKYLTCNLNDLELRQFKVIQGQWSWCQSIAHGPLSIWLLLTPTSYLSPYLKYLTCNLRTLDYDS